MQERMTHGLRTATMAWWNNSDFSVGYVCRVSGLTEREILDEAYAKMSMILYREFP